MSISQDDGADGESPAVRGLNDILQTTAAAQGATGADLGTSLEGCAEFSAYPDGREEREADDRHPDSRRRGGRREREPQG